MDDVAKNRADALVVFNDGANELTTTLQTFFRKVANEGTMKWTLDDDRAVHLGVTKFSDALWAAFDVVYGRK